MSLPICKLLVSPIFNSFPLTVNGPASRSFILLSADIAFASVLKSAQVRPFSSKVPSLIFATVTWQVVVVDAVPVVYFAVTIAGEPDGVAVLPAVTSTLVPVEFAGILI